MPKRLPTSLLWTHKEDLVMRPDAPHARWQADVLECSLDSVPLLETAYGRTVRKRFAIATGRYPSEGGSTAWVQFKWNCWLGH